MTSSQPASLPCFLVNSLANNSQEQCKFMIDNECLEEDSAIDYVYLVYCEIGYDLRYLSILLIAFFVIVLFLALSAVADEFLCPSLLAVAKNLRMSDSLAGVTLLAFGNGCPDIFSSLAAASDDRSELIIGELLGAGIFCTSIVSGLIFIHSDFKLACRPILRDTTFYLLAVYLIWSYCWDEIITFYGSLAFILVYVIYLIVALSGQAIHSRLQGNYAIAETQASANEFEDKDNNENWFKWREESLRRKKLAEKEKKMETTALTSTIKVHYNGNITSIHLNNRSEPSLAPVSEVQQQIFPVEMQLYTSSAPTSPVFREPKISGGYINKAFEQTNNDNSSNNKFEIPMKAHNHQQRFASQQIVKLETQPAVIRPGKGQDVTYNEWDEFLTHINPIDLENWDDARLGSKVINIIRAPLLFVALITIPVVDSDKRLSNWCRLLNSLHCITVPLAMVLSTNLGANDSLSLFGLPLPVLVLVPGVLLAAFVLKKTSAYEVPKYLPVFAYFGFIMSIMWIYLLATEIISLLKTVGIMFGMTDTAIGLGILAWGNSLGDIVANISLADAGYPRMAIGASIGAPLLNLLLGFGLSFTISLKPGQSSVIEYSPTITLLCSTLAIILISLMLSTLAPPGKSKKPFGYLLIGGYGVYFALAICLEYKIIKF